MLWLLNQNPHVNHKGLDISFGGSLKCIKQLHKISICNSCFLYNECSDYQELPRRYRVLERLKKHW